MLSRDAAQALVDALATVALAASAARLARRGVHSALEARLALLLATLAAFYGTRAAFGATQSRALEVASLVAACAVPLGVLVLAEGVLRRHAPRWLKLLVTAGAVIVAAALVIDGGRPPASGWILAAYELPSLAAITLLLLLRDRASLSAPENASVGALVGAGVLVTAFSATDFLVATPLGVSGLAAAGVTFLLNRDPSGPREGRAVLAQLGLLAIAAGLAAFALAMAIGLAGVECWRLGAVLLGLLLAADGALGPRRMTGRGPSSRFTEALARADLSSLDRFLEALADQPRLAGLRLAEAALLAEYDAEGLGRALAAGPVWTRARLAAGEPAADRAHEELADLMARTEATHAILITAAPLRIALLTLPQVGLAEATDADLALFARLAATAAQDATKNAARDACQ